MNDVGTKIMVPVADHIAASSTGGRDQVPIPRATYRLQFHKGFGFADAAALAPYLAKLGISHVYASPWLKARADSTHGYDIVDHRRLNPELGDERTFRAMVAAFQANGIGQILDFVPNHMGVGGSTNPWWQDVLEWGPESEYAGWFDIDWDPDPRYLRGKLLVPFLGDQYGAVLEAGHLRLRFQPDTGDLAVWAYDTHKLPICPLHYQRILGHAHPMLERLGDAFSGLPRWHPRIANRASDLRADLRDLISDDGDARAALDDALARLNGTVGDLDTWRGLDALIQDQHWRVAHFRVAADDINYRRFFNINELAGLRMELPELFDQAHGLVFDWLADGTLDGLRIDHVDGLFDPKAYLVRLREKAPRPFYLVIEKILARHETLPDDWPVDGTTGYEFANLVLGLLVDPAGEAAFTKLYAAFAGAVPPFNEPGFSDPGLSDPRLSDPGPSDRDFKAPDFNAIVRDCKIRIMLNEMAGELNVVARDAARVARLNPRTADFTRNILQRGLKEIIACFPVYRTYIDGEGVPSDADRRDLDWAVTQARRNETDVDASVFDFLTDLLSTDLVARPRSGFSREAVVRFAMRVQQYSGPVMAKGLEDTAFYRYNRFIALNEVGGHPDHFGVSVAAFHKANAQRAVRSPHAMLGTSTHDTKRGEDVRARLAVLSEMPDEWQRQVQIWNRILRARMGDLIAAAPPDRNDEYLFYQLLVGAWPAELTGVAALDAGAVGAFAQRLEATMVKSIREAKLHSTWASPNASYEDATANFVRLALDASRPNAFLDALLPFQERVARLGVHNSLVQTTLKLTLPGMPDIYQGAELWDLSLVDPDNRRPVDYAVRARLLDHRGDLPRLMKNWRDGRCKLVATAALLARRRVQPELFADGTYEPVTATGAKADEVCAFARRHGEAMLLVVVARFPARRATAPDWGDTALASPRIARWRDILTGRTVENRSGDDLPVRELLGDLPVAALVPDDAA